jgi:SAM-dependent methyltransferase
MKLIRGILGPCRVALRPTAVAFYRILAGRFLFGPFLTRCRMLVSSFKKTRRLEIGTSGPRIPGFETLSIVPGRHVDYLLDASRPLPFPTGTFRTVYASHVLEHIAWFQAADVVAEWVRILRPGGTLEIFLPDGLKICRSLVKYETEGRSDAVPDGWLCRNPDGDPCVWASGRIYYGNAGYGSWHRALFTPRFLAKIMKGAGLKRIGRMRASETRGVDHGWINLGMRGVKP